jgi:hypothetical protein
LKGEPRRRLLMEPAEKQVEVQVEVGEFMIDYAMAGSGEPLLLLQGSEPVEIWRA